MLQPVIRPTAPHFATKESLQAPSTRSGGSPIRTQNSACPVGQISGLVCASRTHERGATRSSRVLGAGCNGRAGAAGRATPMRTAKSCGPDLPTLGSSLCATSAQTTVAIKPGTPGRARISRQTVARGLPVAPAEPVVTAACFFVAGGPWVRPASGIPRALSSSRDVVRHDSDASRAAGMLSDVPSAVMLRESGASSIPETSEVTTAASGILDRPLSRAMTSSEPFEMCIQSRKRCLI
jgi:hypothetical protein